MQLTGISFQELQTALAAAPFGYELPMQRFTDWRSWEAFFGRTYCLNSIFLMQSFPTGMCAPPSALVCVRVTCVPGAMLACEFMHLVAGCTCGTNLTLCVQAKQPQECL